MTDLLSTLFGFQINILVYEFGSKEKNQKDSWKYENNDVRQTWNNKWEIYFEDRFFQRIVIINVNC